MQDNNLSLTHSDSEVDPPVDPSGHSDPLMHVVPVVSDVVGVEQLYNEASKQKMHNCQVLEIQKEIEMIRNELTNND